MYVHSNVTALGALTKAQSRELLGQLDDLQMVLSRLRTGVNRARAVQNSDAVIDADYEVSQMEHEHTLLSVEAASHAQGDYVGLTSAIQELLGSAAQLEPQVRMLSASAVTRERQLRYVGGAAAVAGAVFVGWLIWRGSRA